MHVVGKANFAFPLFQLPQAVLDGIYWSCFLAKPISIIYEASFEAKLVETCCWVDLSQGCAYFIGFNYAYKLNCLVNGIFRFAWITYHQEYECFYACLVG